MDKKNFLSIFAFFLVWRVMLSVFLFIAPFWLPIQQNFLGGGMSNYLQHPQLWAWLNFDGEHYFAIAREGYKPLTHFYFPFYPLLIRFFSSTSLISSAIIGLAISHISFIFALFGLFKLLKFDYNSKIIKLTFILLVIFPTSFYFASYYTESLFFALIVWSFLFARKKQWLIASLFGFLAASTRLVGIILFPALLVEYLLQHTSKKLTIHFSLLTIFLIPFGLFAYMIYLKQTTGDPFIFLNTVSIFGDQRSSHFIFLPQVFYRYIFKIIPNLTDYWPVIFVTLLEFITGLIFIILSVFSIFKLRPSYSVFLIGGYLIPTLSGSFSSLPRYVLVLFPGFILMAIYLSKLALPIQKITFAILFICLAIASSLFFRGYWIS